MSSGYVPGAPSPYFPKHEYFGIPVNRIHRTYHIPLSLSVADGQRVIEGGLTAS